jgi:hypothetical protein
MPLLPETPVLGLLEVPPLLPPPLSAPDEPAPTLDEPDDLLEKDWSPLLKPPLAEAAVPLPVPPDSPLVALTAPPVLFVAATPPPVPDDLPLVAYGCGWTLE